MKGAKILLGVSAALAAIVSLALLFSPISFLASQGIQADAKVALIAQAQGSILIALGVINLMALRLSDVAGVRAVLAGNLVTHIVALGVNAHAIMANLVTNQVYGDVGMHVLFGALFGFFLLRTGKTAA